MPSIFVCPLCFSVSKVASRCYLGTFCDRDGGEARIKYIPASKQTSNVSAVQPEAQPITVPFKVGDNCEWVDKPHDYTECLSATIVEILDGPRIVSALVKNPAVKRTFSFWERRNEWRCGYVVLTSIE